MTAPFMNEYLSSTNARLKQLLYVMNPSKLRATEFLVRFHEERGDKIIVFSDLVYSLKLYADMLKRPLIYGETPERERQAILGTFRTSDAVRTICISKVGDTSIDLPEANVIIQIASHFGARRQEALPDRVGGRDAPEGPDRRVQEEALDALRVLLRVGHLGEEALQ